MIFNNSEDLSESAGVFCGSCSRQVINCFDSVCVDHGNGEIMEVLVSLEFLGTRAMHKK